ncbi:MAG: DUF1559 domain-containing protein [Pirellulaceae bacterium]|nr:DUF1559 domain-containing protein [Pirellulaceae bacterium]
MSDEELHGDVESRDRKRHVFTIRDLLILSAIVAVFFAVVLPLLGRQIESARRDACQNNLRQIGLGLHNYHAAYRHLPSAMGGSGSGPTPRHGNALRLSGLIAVSPFIESQALWEIVSNPSFHKGVNYPPMGPVPWDAAYPPWQEQIPTLRCPSEPTKQKTFARTNYLFSVGDSVQNLHAMKRQDIRGVFAPGHFTRFRDILDGLSNTIMMMETANARSDYLAGQFVVGADSTKMLTPSDCAKQADPNRRLHYLPALKLSDLGRGGNWADGAAGYSLVHTILPPNSPSCAIGGTSHVDGFYSASSAHRGGCLVLMSDGAVGFVSDSIDVGDSTKTTPTSISVQSPYGVLGAIGTRASLEGDVGFELQ